MNVKTKIDRELQKKILEALAGAFPIPLKEAQIKEIAPDARRILKNTEPQKLAYRMIDNDLVFAANITYLRDCKLITCQDYFVYVNPASNDGIEIDVYFPDIRITAKGIDLLTGGSIEDIVN